MKMPSYSNDWEIPAFVTLTKDVELFAEFKRLNRFKMGHNPVAGFYTQVTFSKSMDNMMFHTHQLIGVAHKYKNYEKRSCKSRDNHPLNEKWIREYTYTFYNEKKVNYGFEGDMIKHNIAYKSNARVTNFFEKLSKRDRFTQYCIIRGKEWSQETYDWFLDEMNESRLFEEMMDSAWLRGV